MLCFFTRKINNLTANRVSQYNGNNSSLFCSYFWRFFIVFCIAVWYSTGFCFGPSLLNVFINDLCNVVQCFVYLPFVGDINICRAIQSPNDSNLLQSDIDSRRS
jgi:hypothetical protein